MGIKNNTAVRLLARRAVVKISSLFVQAMQCRSFYAGTAARPKG